MFSNLLILFKRSDCPNELVFTKMRICYTNVNIRKILGTDTSAKI